MQISQNCCAKHETLDEHFPNFVCLVLFGSIKPSSWRETLYLCRFWRFFWLSRKDIVKWLWCYCDEADDLDDEMLQQQFIVRGMGNVEKGQGCVEVNDVMLLAWSNDQSMKWSSKHTETTDLWGHDTWIQYQGRPCRPWCFDKLGKDFVPIEIFTKFLHLNIMHSLQLLSSMFNLHHLHQLCTLFVYAKSCLLCSPRWPASSSIGRKHRRTVSHCALLHPVDQTKYNSWC